MPYYVYIIQSEKDGSFYKGFTVDFMKRLQQHNNGESQYTSSKLPWKLIYVEEQLNKKDALIREKNLKKATRERILHLISSEKNLLHNKAS
jgi:putative endonuclease